MWATWLPFLATSPKPGDATGVFNASFAVRVFHRGGSALGIPPRPSLGRPQAGSSGIRTEGHHVSAVEYTGNPELPAVGNGGCGGGGRGGTGVGRTAGLVGATAFYREAPGGLRSEGVICFTWERENSESTSLGFRGCRVGVLGLCLG